MTSTYILIFATLILGGLIALLGDRLGTKVGKARLRLFKLRPRQTATVITIIAGTLISASTLGILLLLSESLRDGLFELDEIKADERAAKRALNEAIQEKEQIAQQLTTIKEQQTTAQKQLEATKTDFQKSIIRLQDISQQAEQLRQELDILLTERRKQIEQLNNIKEESEVLQNQLEEKETQIKNQDRAIITKESSIQELKEKQQVLQSEVSDRDKKIARLDRAISSKDIELKSRINRLDFLEKRVATLEEYYDNYQELRERRIAVFKGEVLASATIRIVDPNAAIPAIDRLLGQANRNAIQSTLPDSKESSEQRVVRITTSQVEQLATQLQDGEDYVVRILSAGNYVLGEREVRVFADTTVNREIFQAGESIARVSIDYQQIDNAYIQERLDWLLAASKFRAQRAGIIGDLQIGDGQIATIINFIDKVANAEEPLGEIQAVVAETTYTAGPLKLNLVVIKDGAIVLST